MWDEEESLQYDYAADAETVKYTIQDFGIGESEDDENLNNVN